MGPSSNNEHSPSAVDRPRRPILWTNAAFLILTPILAMVAVPWYAVSHGIGWTEIAACLGLWLLTGLSVTAGYHRLFSHRSYEAVWPVRLVLVLLGGATWQNSVIAWCAAHRYHHRDVDSEGDPYNPQEGFWYSHMGWVMVEGSRHGDTANVPDLWKDPICRWQHRHYLLISTAVNLGLVLLLGWLTGRMLGMLIFGLLVRVVLTHHFTFLVNSAAHMWGTQPWSKGHSARDNWALSLFTFGEGYHNYHHTFQVDYRNGPLWYNWDPSKWLIWLLASLGLARRLRRNPIDVALGRRFELAHRHFNERLTRLGATLDDLGGQLADEVDVARRALAERFLAAEQQVREALDALADARRTVQQAAANQRASWRVRRRLATARRSTRRALRHWQQVGERYLGELDAGQTDMSPA